MTKLTITTALISTLLASTAFAAPQVYFRHIGTGVINASAAAPEVPEVPHAPEVVFGAPVYSYLDADDNGLMSSGDSILVSVTVSNPTSETVHYKVQLSSDTNNWWIGSLAPGASEEALMAIYDMSVFSGQTSFNADVLAMTFESPDDLMGGSASPISSKTISGVAISLPAPDA